MGEVSPCPLRACGETGRGRTGLCGELFSCVVGWHHSRPRMFQLRGDGVGRWFWQTGGEVGEIGFS
jgi:hypothetical protein